MRAETRLPSRLRSLWVAVGDNGVMALQMSSRRWPSTSSSWSRPSFTDYDAW